MKKIILITTLFLTTTLLQSCTEEEKVVQKYYKTEIVQTWSLASSVAYTSYTKGINEAILSPKTSGRVVYMWFNIWDKVSIWERLASLDWAEAQVWYSTANNIVSSLVNLKKSTISSYDEQINSLKQTLKKAETNLEWASLWINNNSEAQLTLELEKTNLEETKNVLSWEEETIYKNAESAITNSVILNTNIINFIDELLWVTPENDDKNDSFEDYLWAKKITVYNKAKNYFTEVNLEYFLYKSFYENNIENSSPSKKQIIMGLEKWKNLAANIKELLNLTYDVLDYSLDNVYLTLNEINSYKERVTNYWNSIEASLITVSGEYLLWLRWSLENIDSFNRNSTKQIELLEQKVSLARQWLENKEKIAKISIEEISSQIKSLEKQKLAKLSEIDSQISEARWSSNSAAVMIWNTEVVSNLNWIIINKMSEVWTVVQAWTPIYKVADNSKIKLEVSVPYTISQNLELWKKVIVEIEWKNKNYIWFINNLPTNKDIETKKTIIEVVIWNQNSEIEIWTIAKVYFGDNIESWILIPNKAIISKYMLPWIMVKEWNIAKFKEIEIIKTNDTFSLVKWINPLEEIIIEWQENIWDEEILN